MISRKLCKSPASRRVGYFRYSLAKNHLSRRKYYFPEEHQRTGNAVPVCFSECTQVVYHTSAILSPAMAKVQDTLHDKKVE